MYSATTFFKTIVSFLCLIQLVACTAHYPVNKSITSVDAVESYSLNNESVSERSDDLLLILTYSGGGTRGMVLW